MSQEIVVREGGKLVTRDEKTITNVGAIIALDLLEEIANRLAVLQHLGESEQCQGEERGFEVQVTDSLKEVEVRDPVTGKLVEAHTASIFNDGASATSLELDTVYITVNYPHHPGMLKLNRGDKQDIDYSKAKKKITHFYLWCDPGVATWVRIHVKY